MHVTLTTPDQAVPAPESDGGVPLSAFERLFTLVSDLVVATRTDGEILLVNPAWEDMLGWRPEDLIGRSIFEFMHPDDRAASRAIPDDRRSVVNFTNRYRHRDGSWRSLLWSGRADGEVWYAVAKNVTEHLILERRALYDELTGLANRALLLDHLAGASARLRRGDGRLLAVLFVDLDGFKLINDRYGHEAGDEVLAGAARRLREVVPDPEVISRFGGDEFVIAAEVFSREGEALALAQRVVEVLGLDFALKHGRCALSCSVGIATTRDPNTDPDVILREADVAMYRAKIRAGEGGVVRRTSEAPGGAAGGGRIRSAQGTVVRGAAGPIPAGGGAR